MGERGLRMGRLRAALVVVCCVLLVGIWGTGSAAAQGPQVIEAQDAAWNPANVQITTGETVRWEFDESQLPHNVKSSSGNWSLQSSTASDAPVEYTFTAPGTYSPRSPAGSSHAGSRRSWRRRGPS